MTSYLLRRSQRLPAAAIRRNSRCSSTPISSPPYALCARPDWVLRPAGRSRRVGAGARRICDSAHAQRDRYVPSVFMHSFSLEFSDRPGAAREFTYPAEAPLPHDPNLTLPLPIPALEPSLATPAHCSIFSLCTLPSGSTDGRIISAGIRIRCYCSNLFRKTVVNSIRLCKNCFRCNTVTPQ
ncbi:hypothetical protein EDB83DRAFT_1017132 [Lactarius deliciosus]|nr:hypothetical protein EDB83DRAFT_1017132 [Lactarius deliciosus]